MAPGTQKQHGRHFIYGLPELNRDAIRKAANIANPGCFATGIQLALLPLASEGLLDKEVHLTAVTGSTGAGQAPSGTTHFSWRNNNLSVYKAFGHQHLKEITRRSEEHTSELQSLMRISYAVFCLKKKKNIN